MKADESKGPEFKVGNYAVFKNGCDEDDPVGRLWKILKVEFSGDQVFVDINLGTYTSITMRPATQAEIAADKRLDNSEIVVGSKVVQTIYSSPRIWTVKELGYNGNPRVVLLEAESWVPTTTVINCIRLATQQEISVGRRIEQRPSPCATCPNAGHKTCCCEVC